MLKRSAADPARREQDLHPVTTQAPNGQDRPRCYNAVWQGNRVCLLERVGDRVVKRDVLAEYSCFIPAHQIEPVLSEVTRSSRVRGARKEGDWYRVRFASWNDRKDVCAPERGVGTSVMQRNGLDCYEADLNPVKRWLVDNDVEIQRPRRVYLDIEADSRVPFSEKSRARILCWVLVDHDTGRTVLGMLEADTDEAERDLLEDLWFELQDFDQVAAWYGGDAKEDSYGYDFPMIVSRSKRLGINVDPRRWLWVDQLEIFKKFNASSGESGDEKATLSLDSVAKKLLGHDEGKLEGIDGSMSWLLWELGDRHYIANDVDYGPGRPLLGRYCVRDTALLRGVEEKTGFLELLYVIGGACGCFPDNYGSKGVNYVENFVMRLGHRRGMRFPSNWRDTGRNPFDGARVFEPTETGIIHNVHVCDFSGMYPSIIQSLNLSFETHVPELRAVKGSTRPAYLAHVKDESSLAPLPPGHCRVPITGEVFRTEPLGVLPEAMDIMRETRKFYDKKKASLTPGTHEFIGAERGAQGAKIFVNTFFGVAGSPFSRLYKREVGEAITQTGVWLIETVAREATKRGMRFLYGDSVTGDRIIITRDPAGHVQMLTAAELWARGIPANGESSDGKEYGELNGWKALARGERGDDWYPISRVMRHASGKPTWRVGTKHGQTCVTADHGIMVDGVATTPERFVADRARFTCLEAPASRVVMGGEEIDLWDYVRDFQDRYQYRGREVVRRFHAKPGYLFLDGWGDGENQMRIRRWYRMGSPEFHALLRLIGLYVGDGSASTRATNSRYMLSFCKQHEPVIQQAVEDLAAISPGLHVFGPYWSETVFVARSGTAAMACLFAALCGSKSRNKRLPSFAFDLAPEDAEQLINALQDGDGYVNGGGRFESYTTNSAKLAAGVSYLLDQQGWPHGWWYRREKAAWTLKIRSKRDDHRGNERCRYQIQADVFEPIDGEYVYDLTVEGAHTFVDGIGRVLLHNTDSGYIAGTTEAEFRTFIKELNEIVFPALLKDLGCTRNMIDIAYEKEFETLILLPSKKRYAGRYRHYKGKLATAESKAEIKGLEYKRGDTAKICREFQRRTIELLLSGDERLETYVALVAEERARVLDGALDSSEFVMSKRMNGSIESYSVKKKNDGEDSAQPIHVQVARRMRELGMDVSEGTRVQYVVVDASDNLKAVPLCEYQPGSEDRYYLWENLVYPATQRVLEACFKTHDWRLYARARPPKPRRGKPVPEEQTGFNFSANPGLPTEASPAHEITQRSGEVPGGRDSSRPAGGRDATNRHTGADRIVLDRSATRAAEAPQPVPSVSRQDADGRRGDESAAQRRPRSAAGRAPAA